MVLLLSGKVLSRKLFGKPNFFVVSLCGIVFASAVACAGKEPGRQYKRISLQGLKVKVELASTPEARSQGLMNRDHLEKNTGMLFVFPAPQKLSFWMKNTKIPLSIGFFDEKKKLIEVLEMELESMMRRNLRQYQSSQNAQYALEMNKGWFKKNKIKKGSKFSFLP